MADEDKADGKAVEVRLLRDGAHGKINDVASLDKATAKALQADGGCDPHPDAVAYAKSLKK